jgi:hypothetical protein
MPDKKSLAEAVALIRRQKKIVKKSLAGIGREFDVSAKPETRALVSNEGTAVMNKLQPLRRKLRLAKPKTLPEPEPAPAPAPAPAPEPEPVAQPVVEEKKEEPVKEEKVVKNPVVKIEKKPARYRYKRNDQNTLVL